MEAEAMEQKSWDHPGGKLLELGPDALTQDELFAIVIGSGVRGKPAMSIAKAVLDDFGGIYEVFRVGTVERLAQIGGLGERKSHRLLAALQMGRRLSELQKRQAKLRPWEPKPNLITCLEHPPGTQSGQLYEAELLSQVIGAGTKGRRSIDIAQDLLSRFGSSLEGLYGQKLKLFMKVRGLDSVKVVRICAALEIAKRIAHALS